MRIIAKNIASYSIWSMKLLAIFILFAASSYAQTFESRTVNLVSGTPPDLDAYQANIKGYEWTLRNGAGVISLSGRTPFMYWYREPFTSAIVTASVSVVSATGGVFRATFQPSDLNPSWFTNATSGSTNLRYAVGIEYSGGDEAVSHGRLRLIADPGAAGAVGVTFFTTNINWALINWTGLPDWMLDADADGSLYARRDGAWEEINVPSTSDVARALAWAQAGSNLAATANGAAQVASNLAFSASQSSTDLTARAWAVAASNLAAAGSSAVSLAAISNLVVGTSNELSGRIVATSNRAEAAYVRAFASATGTPVYAESDPLFVAASNALLTKAQAASMYATGTPVYAVSGLGTDAYARTTAEWASNRANAAHSIASAAATGSPIYSISGLATGTPVYTESDPVYVSASTGLLTKVQASALYATGTPLYVESNLSALSNGVANATATGSLALAWAQAGSNLAAQGISAVVASNSFVKKSGDTMTSDLAMGGQNVTNVNSIYGPGSGAFINLDDPIIAGTKAWEFERQPSIPGYLQTTGTYNLASGTNAPAAWTAQPSLLALSNGLAAASALGTNAQIAASNAQTTASNAQTTASAATNLAYAIGAGATNGILNVGLVATNAQQVASNGLATAQAAQVQASNINAAAWSQIATGAVSMATNRINQISAISFVNNATIGDIDYGLLFTNGYPAYAQGSSRYSFYGTWNFSPSSYQTAAAQASYATNAIKLFAGIVTQNQITARNQAFFDGTNLWIGLGGTNSLRMGGVLNAY